MRDRLGFKDDLYHTVRKYIEIVPVPDPLSDVLSLLDVQAARCKRFEAGRDFAMRFPPKHALKFAAVISGKCWIKLEGMKAVPLATGDAFLLANAPAYLLATNVELPPEDGFAAYSGGRADSLRLGGDDIVLVSGEFVFDAGNASILLDALPPFIHVSADTHSAIVVRDTLAMLNREMLHNEAGRGLVMRRLADIALVQIIRAYLAQDGQKYAKWLNALSDDRISAALSSIHARPAHGWTVAELAAGSSMSRSVFAKRFNALVGIPPLEYLSRWRLQRAREALVYQTKPLKQISLDAGYASESAFGLAFKRMFGCPPGLYRSGASKARHASNKASE